MSRTLRPALLRRISGGDDRGSLPLVMLVILIGSGLAGLLLPMLVQQGNNTKWDTKRVREINAAQAGLDIALGLIRDAVISGSEGDVNTLPCSTAGAITGSVAGDGNLTYSIKLGYYTENPAGKVGDWLKPYAAGHAEYHGMICAEGAGTYYPPTDARVPSFIRIVSTGSDGNGVRSIAGTYVVQTTNASVVGGVMKIYPITTSPLPAGYPDKGYCMDATNPQPSAGTSVYVEPCNTDDTDRPIPQQAWAYRSDLTIQLVSSVDPNNPNGLCLSGWNAGAPTNASGAAVLLQPCSPLGSSPYYQQFSVNNSGHLEISNNAKTDVYGVCIMVANQNGTLTQRRLQLQGSATNPSSSICRSGSTTDTSYSWVPSPFAGSGAAGATITGDHQFVNFLNFSQCMDVTNTNGNRVTPTAGYTPGGGNFLIAYACKQNPDPTKVLWNQKFQQTAYGTLATQQSATQTWCVRSSDGQWTTPGDGTSPSHGPWVTTVACSAGGSITASQCTGSASGNVDLCRWDVYGATQPNGDPEVPDRKYRVINRANGLCLSITAGNTDLYNQFAKIIVEPCSADRRQQQWNAQADRVDPSLQDYNEVYGDGS